MSELVAVVGVGAVFLLGLVFFLGYITGQEYAWRDEKLLRGRERPNEEEQQWIRKRLSEARPWRSPRDEEER